MTGPQRQAPATGRELILARISAALADRPAPAPVSRSYRLAGTPVEVDLLALLAERITDYRATVHRCAEPAAAVIGELVGDRRVVVPAGFPPEWSDRVLNQVGDQPELTAAELDRLDGVLSTCALAIAETGTIVLDAGPGQGRRALTLVPDYHLAVVRAEQVVRTVPDAVSRLAGSRTLTWISGPSATSDIELSRVEGVHGPRTLVVVLIG